MHRRQRTLVELLTRSLAAAGLLYGLIFAYVVPANLMAQQYEVPMRRAPHASPSSRVMDEPRWKPAHADRFPGCVDVARWPSETGPASVVVVRRNGDLQRMSLDEAYRRATSDSAADDVWTIGACG